MLYSIIEQARRLQATDVHLHAGMQPSLRVLGKLQLMDGHMLNSSELQSISEEILDDRHRDELSRKGETDLAITDSTEGRCRINIYQAEGNLSMAIRLIQQQVPSCEDLQLPQGILDFVKLRQGLVLVTGPTGSGKSTTLAALLNKLNQEERLHILTLEDPIEYVHLPINSLINQREIGQDTGSFASGLRSALRQDPDVIMVGELRDRETMEVALTAAETGHLVFSTLHTMGAVATVDRLIDSFADKGQIRNQLATCLQGVVSQQLLRKRDGSGRVAAFEILVATEAMRNLIREGKSYQLSSYVETGSRYGMITMEKSLQQLKSRGII